jgi:predicted RNase H-like HicB family nuclease
MSGTTIPRLQVRALVHADETGGYWAEVPAIPGCYTQADSLDELVANLVDAVAAHQGLPKSDVTVAALEMAQ